MSEPNFSVIIFKNNKKRKILKSFVTEQKAIEFYEKKLKESSEILFDKLIENATTVKDKIKIFKKIIIKDFKLTSKDFEIILKYYLQEEDNIIQPILRDQDVEDSE